MKVNKLFAVLLLMLVAFSTNMMTAQEMTLPIDPAVRIGKLNNGLTYYIRHNNYPEKRANFYIAQRVGAMQEEDDQNGLAHFLEHMAFNGSEHFNGEGHRIDDYLQSKGYNNAYTNYTETVYIISDVPTTDQGVVDSCMLILKDWSHGLLLTDEEIDKERGVIHEEWRLGRDANDRMRSRQMETLFPGSKYAKRDVIGSMDVVDNFPYKVLRDYYDKWYRPDNQALVIVGDIDVDYIEAKIKDLFKNVPPPAADAAQVVPFPIPDNDEPIVAIDKDVEQQFSVVQLFFKHDIVEKEAKNSVDYLAAGYMKSMMGMMLNQRLQELAQDPNCPFLQAYAFDGKYMGANTKDAFTLIVVPKEGMTEAATQVGLTEVLRAAKYGFTATEYARAQENYQSSLERQYNERDKVHNSSYTTQCYRHFLDNEPLMSVEDNYQYMTAIAPQIPVEYINQLLTNLVRLDGKNMVVVNFNQEKDGAVYPTKEGMLNAVNAAETAEITPYVDNVKQEPLIAKLPKNGKIVKERNNETLGYKELELSNGARVLLKPTDFKQDEILMLARQRGGSSLYGEQDWANCEMFDDVVESSGLGGFNNMELTKALAGKNVSVHQTLYTNYDYVTGNSNVKDLETLFQLVYLQFTDITKDEKNYNKLISTLDMVLKNKDLDPDNVFNDSLSYILNNYSWRNKPFTADAVKQVNYDRILEIAKERTANAANYTFLFVGSFDEAVIRPLIEQYLGSLPSQKKIVKGKDVSTDYTGKVVNDFKHKAETPKAIAVLHWYSKKVPFTLENAIRAQAVGQVLQMIYLKEIREEASAAYTAAGQAGISRDDFGDESSILGYCPMKPEKADTAVFILRRAVEDMAAGKCDADMVTKVKEYMVKNHGDQLKTNGYWSDRISMWRKWNLDFDTDYEKTVEAITPASLCAFVKEVLKAGNEAEIVMMPAE